MKSESDDATRGRMSSNGDVSPSSVPSEWVRLNVGGTVFTTTKSTLQKDRESFLVSDD